MMKWMLGLALGFLVVASAKATRGSIAATSAGRSSANVGGEASGPTPVRRVVNLLTEMQKQVESELKEDEDVYGKMDCWCTTNEREKTAAIEIAKTRIGELGAAIEEGIALASKLVNEIEVLKEEIQETQDSIDKATGIRDKEKAEFEDEEKEMMDTLAALKEAIPILEKVQLAQTSGQPAVPQASLLQLRRLASKLSAGDPAKKRFNYFKNVMQKDMWAFLGTMPHGDSNDGGERVVTDLAQQPTGAAAGAKSYNARSSKILGILVAMQDNFKKDLGAAQKDEIVSELQFQRLRSAKEGEMRAAMKALQERETRLADTHEKLAQDKADLEETTAALAADEKFLLDLQKRCKIAAEEYDKRSLTRRQEVVAISETIKILEQDDARDLYAKTITFLQTGTERTEVRRARVSAASQIMTLARRQGSASTEGWRLATLAVSVQHDGFTKVKIALEKMLAELKKQNEEEYQKKEACVADIQSVEGEIRVKNNEAKDLNALITSLSATSAQLAKDLEDLRRDVALAHVSLKAASEDRKAENHEFQQVVSDQRETVAILKKAMARMQQFYGEQAFLQARKQVPGAAVAPPPKAGLDYQSQDMAPGVMQMLEKVTADAERADKEAVAQEQTAEAAYGEVVANINAMLDESASSITQKTIAKEKADVAKLEAKKDLRAAVATLKDLAGQEEGYHLSCDFVINNYQIRQTARSEEIVAIQTAQAILRGANFFE